MKTILRTLSFGGPYKILAPAYFIFTILGGLLAVTNLILLGPLFEIIFDKIPQEEIIKYKQIPVLSFDLVSMKEYFKSIFYHYFLSYIEIYGKTGALIFVGVLLVITNFTANGFKYLSILINSYLRIRLVKRIRVATYNKVINSDLENFTLHPKGDLISRMMYDVATLESMLTHSFQIVISEPILIILHLVTLLSISPKLTMISLIILPVSAFLISHIAKLLKSQSQLLQNSFGRLTSLLDESFGGIRIIKSSTAENYMYKKMKRLHEELSKLNFHYLKRMELASPLSELFGVTLLAVILITGGFLVLEENILEASTFLVYLVVFVRMLEPAKQVSRAYTGIQIGLISSKRIFEIIDRKENIKDIKTPKKINGLKRSITFNINTFSYINDKVEILKNIKFELPKGKTYALVGPSGGGKSTLVNLLPRFYDVDNGSIDWDNIPIKDIEQQNLRELIGIVSQEAILFNDTIFNNIAFGVDNPSKEKVIKAAKIANAHGFISEFNDGYDTIIGEGGGRLSGGQKQRISIARAILKDPPVLILDEATSALDTESERLVQNALENLLINRTALVIAHRLSTIKNADKILVMQEGTIAEEGSHQELTHVTNGIYQKLVELQSVNKEQ